MPTTATLVVCNSTHSPREDLGYAEPVRRGDLLGADDPRVLAAPALFTQAGMELPPADWQNDARQRELDALVTAEVAAKAAANRVSFGEGATKLFRANRDFQTSINGEPATVTKGSVLREGHWLLSEAPDCWVELRPR